MKQRAAAFALLSWMLFGAGHAFCPETRQIHHASIRSTLSLVPGQGNQLVAAYTAASCKGDNQSVESPVPVAKKVGTSPEGPDAAAAGAVESHPSSSSSHWRALAGSRSFVARLFHIPSGAIKSHPHPDAEMIKPSHQASFPHSFMPHQPSQPPKEHDSVLYPIVGFRFVTTDDGEAMALPTTSNASCSLHLQKRTEGVVGWYSPSCKLDLYSEDPCHKP